MDLTIRQEMPQDHPAVFALIQEAFAAEPLSDHREQFLVEWLRRSEAFVPELSLVAETDHRIVGHILLTRLKIRSGQDTSEALALAPVSVLPEYQRRGVGRRLIRAARERARTLGYLAVVLVGHADYYPRFGYQPAYRFGIELPFEVPQENSMVVALTEGGLKGVHGKVEYPPEFYE
ncbi:GNAT family N-acetyltransferase [Neolewinella litorea]|uniref:N-acetyltransferase n=1 Tax=Neolewinella litorea TaxID=2562452 RepID=A0A4S4NH37_9BACT|nr:N-acetyltransferase [Neolewinella litorea]THH37977.1 N-acetyltransferase [Neolewinella litorea]